MIRQRRRAALGCSSRVGPAPDKVSALSPIHETRDISFRAPLEDLANPRLAGDKQHVAHFNLQGFLRTSFPAADQLLAVPLDQVDEVAGDIAPRILLQNLRRQRYRRRVVEDGIGVNKVKLPFAYFAAPGLGCELTRVEHLAVIILLLVIRVDDGCDIPRDLCGVRSDLNAARSARRQRLKLLQEFAPVHDRSVLIDINGVGRQRMLPDSAVTRRKSVQQRLVLAAEDFRGLVRGIRNRVK